jgi:hypothetical protein
MLSFTCPECYKHLHAAEGKADAIIKCPGCGITFAIPGGRPKPEPRKEVSGGSKRTSPGHRPSAPRSPRRPRGAGIGQRRRHGPDEFRPRPSTSVRDGAVLPSGQSVRILPRTSLVLVDVN